MFAKLGKTKKHQKQRPDPQSPLARQEYYIASPELFRSGVVHLCVIINDRGRFWISLDRAV